MNAVLNLETSIKCRVRSISHVETAEHLAPLEAVNARELWVFGDYALESDALTESGRVAKSADKVRDDPEVTFQHLLARGAALRAESVAEIARAHSVQAQSRVLRAQSAGLVRGRFSPLFGFSPNVP